MLEVMFAWRMVVLIQNAVEWSARRSEMQVPYAAAHTLWKGEAEVREMTDSRWVLRALVLFPSSCDG